MATLPKFIIVGTMKGGTTILYEFINCHNKVDTASQKEIHFFTLYPYKGTDWYKSHFYPKEGNISGEASPTYFDVANTPSIPLSIKSLIPDIKIILIVRDPIERAVSHFCHICKVNQNKKLNEININEFFRKPFLRAYAQTTEIDYYLNQILSFSFYSRKYIIFSSVFNKNNMVVIPNLDLKNEPQLTMKKVFDFLCIEPIESQYFHQFKYSTGSNKDMLDKTVLEKLKNFFYPDFSAFCKYAGLKFDDIIRA